MSKDTVTAVIEISQIILTLGDHIVYGPQLMEMTVRIQPLCNLVLRLCNYFHFHFLNIHYLFILGRCVERYMNVSMCTPIWTSGVFLYCFLPRCLEGL